MKKLGGLIKRHKLLFLICLMAFIVIVMLFYIFFNLFTLGNDPYGNRLKGINSVKISEKLKKDVKSELEGKDEVVSATVRVQGKIVYIHISVKDSVSLDTAKKIASDTLDKFDDSEKAFYDFGYFISQDKEDGFIVTGTKSVKSDHIVWIKS